MLAGLPLFPLRSVLFPGGWLPLQIFEVRYLDMIQRCHEAHEPFGVVCLTHGQEVQQRAMDGDGSEASAYLRETFHDIGTLAHIESLERPQPGLLRVRCRGGQRFQLQHSHKLRHGLWVGRAVTLPDDPATPVPDDLRPLQDGLRDLARRIQAQQPEAFAHSLDDPGWQDAGWLANRWCELLPETAEAKQRLMALDNPLLRLELAGDVVDRLPRL